MSPVVPKVIRYDEKLEDLIAHLQKHDQNPEEEHARWRAIKIIEGEMEFRKSLRADILREIDDRLFSFERETIRDPDIALAEARYGFIHGLAKGSCKIEQPSRQRTNRDDNRPPFNPSHLGFLILQRHVADVGSLTVVVFALA